MSSELTYKKLLALFRVSSEQLTDYLKGASLDNYSIKTHEFQVFCAFTTTASYLRCISQPVEQDVENFNRSIIVTIVDTIIENQPDELSQEKVTALSETITNVFVDRFSSYHEFFQADLQQQENGKMLRFPRLTEGFLDNVLDKQVPESSPVRQLLDATLDNFFTKSAAFFSGCEIQVR